MQNGRDTSQKGVLPFLGGAMKLDKGYKDEEQEIVFNYSVLPKWIKEKGEVITYEPKQVIIYRGGFPQYIYFIKSGIVVGSKDYSDGNEYNFFQADSIGGNLGLLEIFAREEEYSATITCLTEVTVIRIDAKIIYDYVMNDLEMLRRCAILIAKDLYRLSEHEGIFYYLDGINRVRYYFIDYYNSHRNEESSMVIVNAEYRDIATSVGISVRTVGRSIHKLKMQGEILSKNKKVVITKEKYHLLASNIQI